MTRFGLACLIGVLAVAGTTARADLLWDNFLTADPANDGGFDGYSYFSSERNAAVEDSWIADDAFWTHPVTITGIKWAAGRDPRFDYGTVEIIILAETDRALTPAYEFSLGQPTIIDTFGTFQGFEVYNGYTALPAVQLPAGHYYFGIRLVNGANGDEDGRNVFLTTGRVAGVPTINGLTMGMFQSNFFNYPEWTFVGDTSAKMTTDFPFQLFGVPEPEALALAAVAVLMLRRR